ncbi:protocadherin gamma-B4-like [Saccostrea cucullata]|uniref:protocadherin gamma-B4-like n=1 Tax=Saccostrea cuccullata TaxID=36930 RepID=UPI002ED140CC
MKKVNIKIFAAFFIFCGNTFATNFPPRIEMQSGNGIKEVDEDIDIGTGLFNITVRDRNHGSVIVEAVGEASDLVTVNHTQSGTTWGVFLKKKLDRERQSQYLLRFIATSSQKDAPTSALEVTLFVNDINDVAPIFSQPAYRVQVPENYTVAVPINVSVHATDLDNGPWGSVTYDMKVIMFIVL